MSLFPFAYNVSAWDDAPASVYSNELKNNLQNFGQLLMGLGENAKIQYGVPLLENWLYQSRDGALFNENNEIKPIPEKIKFALRGTYDDEILDNVRYTVGNNGALNLSNLSLHYGHAKAITLIDTIVFKDKEDAENNILLWTHELKHIEQFKKWGVDEFALRYIQDWQSVEDEAKNAASDFREKFNIEPFTTIID